MSHPYPRRPTRSRLVPVGAILLLLAASTAGILFVTFHRPKPADQAEVRAPMPTEKIPVAPVPPSAEKPKGKVGGDKKEEPEDDKLMLVSGRITLISVTDVDFGDFFMGKAEQFRPVVVLKRKDESEVYCVFPLLPKEKAAAIMRDLSVGQTVTIRGRLAAKPVHLLVDGKVIEGAPTFLGDCELRDH